MADSRPWFARLLVSPPFHKLVYLAADVFAITLAHMLAFRIVEHIFHVAVTALNPFQYHRFYIPFFTVILYLLEGYKSPDYIVGARAVAFATHVKSLMDGAQ
jgi:hypothetical protein